MSKANEQAKDTTYRAYVTDCLKNISENSAAVSRMCGGEGRYITTRFYDLLHPKPEETRTADQIIQQVLGGLMEVRNDEAV